MPKVTYIDSAGKATELNLATGLTVMEGAVHNSVAGIENECCGKCACATCHVYVDPSWVGRLPPASDIENDLLEGAASPRKPNSRLSCQIRVTPALDGLVVHIPEFQS